MRRVIAGLAIAAAVGTGTGLALANGKAASVKITMREWGVADVPAKVKAGKVTFAVKNVGKLKHEFLVVKTSRKASQLPVKGATAAVTAVPGGKIPQFAGGGTTKTITLTLKAGHYALICNLPAHYKAGQHADFTVG
jgi:uncharacterized cupredoxin-like copper-binding protein